jgi:hypothetical protein
VLALRNLNESFHPFIHLAETAERLLAIRFDAYTYTIDPSVLKQMSISGAATDVPEDIGR